jgi:hypothetical protein
MAKTEFMYKGKKIVIEDDHPNAVVSVDGREFTCHHHHGDKDKGLAMWMCDEAYFASPDLKELARHFADYGYMFDDPGRVLVNEAGEVVAISKKKKGPAKASKQEPGTGGAGSHNHG